MKRAEVYHDATWKVHVREGWPSDRHLAIKDRWAPSWEDTHHRTHAAALTEALAAVGLATAPEHREAP